MTLEDAEAFRGRAGLAAVPRRAGVALGPRQGARTFDEYDEPVAEDPMTWPPSRTLRLPNRRRGSRPRRTGPRSSASSRAMGSRRERADPDASTSAVHLLAGGVRRRLTVLRDRRSSGSATSDAGEIVDQVYLGRRLLAENLPETRLSNIVYMGMGRAASQLRESDPVAEDPDQRQGAKLAQRRITVSDSGLVPKLEKLGNEAVRPEPRGLAQRAQRRDPRRDHADQPQMDHRQAARGAQG